MHPSMPAILLGRVRAQKPVVHHITNWVTIAACADIVKAFGASPVMAHAKEEAADMAGIASALVLNIGTLTPEVIDAMLLAAKSANKKGIPVVLDVCGAGSTKYRDESCAKLLDGSRIDIIKGNASEIARITGLDVKTKGVDSTEVKCDLASTAAKLARERNCTVVITGKEDIVCGASGTYIVKNGHEMMAKAVGTGCMAASVIGTFAAVEKDLAVAAAAGLVCYEVAAENAAMKAKGPGEFKSRLPDEVYILSGENVSRNQKF